MGNNATNISQREAYKLMLKDYPDVLNIGQMCEILSVSTKTGYKIINRLMKSIRQLIQNLKGWIIGFPRLIFFLISASVCRPHPQRLDTSGDILPLEPTR